MHMVRTPAKSTCRYPGGRCGPPDECNRHRSRFQADQPHLHADNDCNNEQTVVAAKPDANSSAHAGSEQHSDTTPIRLPDLRDASTYDHANPHAKQDAHSETDAGSKQHSDSTSE